MALWERGKKVMPSGVPMSWMRGSYHHPPMFVAEGSGSHFRDVDGNDYADFNIADMSMFCGYAPEPVVRAVSERMAAGNQFLLPTEDSVWVSEELGRRWKLPKWQYTSSATQANTEVIRVSRVATGRDTVLMFEGKYHGHFDEALVERDASGEVVPEELGLPKDVVRKTVLVPWNDVDALEKALATGEIAVVLTEPAVSNNIILLQPEPGFHDALRRLTRDNGTLLAIDETHTLVTGPGGLVQHWNLDPDFVIAGKSIAGGVPMGAYGMTEALAALLEQEKDDEGERHDLIATGGTIFGNALAMAAARASLGEVLTDDAYTHTAKLGEQLATGMRDAVSAAGLPWYIHHLYPRAGYTFAPEAPRNAQEAYAAENHVLTRLIRIWLANRGVWEAIVGAGPVVPVPGTAEDVDAYVTAFGELTERIS
jgi:glutamate-1-semialdehyde 2,1-aminomutase